MAVDDEDDNHGIQKVIDIDEHFQQVEKPIQDKDFIDNDVEADDEARIVEDHLKLNGKIEDVIDERKEADNSH